MNINKKLFYLFGPLLGGSIIGIIINKSVDYTNYLKPPLSPPSYVFPIAWSILYVLIGIVYYLYRKNNNNKKTIKIYYIQLLFNYLWPIIFFVLKIPLIANIWIIILTIIVIYLVVIIYVEKKICAYLLIPYILWLLFAVYLNTGIVILN